MHEIRLLFKVMLLSFSFTKTTEEDRLMLMRELTDERERERDRQTDRQTDRLDRLDRQTDRH